MILNQVNYGKQVFSAYHMILQNCQALEKPTVVHLKRELKPQATDRRTIYFCDNALGKIQSLF